MSAAECRHGLNPEWCALCTGRDGGESAEKAEQEELLRSDVWIRSVFPGRCGDCGEPFLSGDPIRRPYHDRTGWVASCCVEENR